MKNRYIIGIDVGGTNSDGVLYDPESRAIVAWEKRPTDHSNFARGIDAAVRGLLRFASVCEIISLNISTTLTTNALLEGRGSPVALVLIGHEKFQHITNEILSTVTPSALLLAEGGHNGWGGEREPLDREAIAHFAKEHAGAYFAVSSFYSPRNPSHEIEAASIIEAAGCSGVTCGHEMARSKLNSVRRAVTAFLNSSLMKISNDLIKSVEFCAASCGLHCPVMFLRSDSSLVGGEWCRRFPLETIFSGPAASMRGGILLGGVSDDGVIADMGGTSTDVGYVKNGKAVYSASGATIGNYKTMIPSLDIHTTALGGDSEVTVDDVAGKIKIGPLRVSPYCRERQTGRYERRGFTPTDALAVLGLSDFAGNERSIRVAGEYGGKIGMTAIDFAQAVFDNVAKRLREQLDERGRSSLRVCVGAPIRFFVKDAAAQVPKEAAIAGAAGAASSSLFLECTVSIVHSFFDENFYAFLPSSQIKSASFDDIYAQAKASLGEYLTRQAALMGFDDTTTAISENFEYIGREESVSSLISLTLNGRAVVRGAQ